MIKSGLVPPELMTQPALPKRAASVPAITKRPPGKTTGRVVMISCNFKKVITEPENETQPTTTVKTVAMISALVASLPRRRYSTVDTSAAAPPPTPLKSATSCGICVIWILRAAGTPTSTPNAIAARIAKRFLWWPPGAQKTSTVPIVAPIAPMIFPRRADLGEESPLRARMKQTAATSPSRS